MIDMKKIDFDQTFLEAHKIVFIGRYTRIFGLNGMTRTEENNVKIDLNIN